MSIRIEGRTSCISPKVASLLFLESLGLRVPPTVIFPNFSPFNRVAKDILPTGSRYYVRLCSHEPVHTGRIAKVVDSENINGFIDSLRGTVGTSTDLFDLVVQPLLQPEISGGVLCLGAVHYYESVLGFAPRLFHRGLLSERLIRCENRVTHHRQYSEFMGLDGLSIETAYHANHYLRDASAQITSMIGGVTEILLEWGICDGTCFVFDHKPIDDRRSFRELRASDPGIPWSVSASARDLKSGATNILEIDTPDIANELEAKRSGAVLVRRGALLSHLAVYSLYGKYRIGFEPEVVGQST